MKLKLIVLLALFAPALLAADEPRVIHDLDYLGSARQEKADLYRPAPHPAGTLTPAILIIHGGGWVGGDKAAEREINIGTTLAAHGYVALSINYHLAAPEHPAASWPQNIRDCKAAVRWLRAYATRYGIPFEVLVENELKAIPKAYADNFAFHRRQPWTH